MTVGAGIVDYRLRRNDAVLFGEPQRGDLVITGYRRSYPGLGKV